MADIERLYADPALADFYDVENGWAADHAFVAHLAASAGSVLDLGCGTGALAAALSAGRHVAGVDPAAAMLSIARSRPGGSRVAWVEGDARDVRLGRRFDLVALTGHAFQVFLTGADRAAVLETIAIHLAPGGRFVFDTRNPAAEEWRTWVPERSRRRIEHPRHGHVESWNDVDYDAATGIARYDTFYALADGKTLHAEARIAFVDRDVLATEIAAAGLVVDRWLGGWDGAPWHAASPEIIPVGRPAA
jgi:SAM-dependent methyltransferase